LAYLLIDQNRLAEAAKVITRAVAHQQAARAMNPRHPVYRQYLRNHYWILADIRVRQGRHAEAVQAAGEMARLFPDRQPDRRDAGWFLARCVVLAEKDSKLSEDERRRLAQSYADRAVQLVREAVQKGYKNFKNLRTNPGYSSLQNRADFRKLVADLEAKTQAGPRRPRADRQ
jgi:hypothetical protein